MLIKPAKYASKDKNYKHVEHLVYSCQYHIVFCPKYRRKVLEPYADRLKELMLQVANENNFQILDMEIMPDHVHLIIDCDPRVSVCKYVRLLKGHTSSVLRKECPEIKRRLPNLWTRSTFISSVGAVTLDIVKDYIEKQKDV